MEKSKIVAIKSRFDETIHVVDNTDVEYWLDRELMILLGYERWENFDKTIIRSMESCQTAEIDVLDHFREVTKMVTPGSGAKREIKDYMLTTCKVVKNIIGTFFLKNGIVESFFQNVPIIFLF